MQEVGKKYNPHWHHTMLNIKYPTKTVEFYKSFGFELLGKYTSQNDGYTIFFMEKQKDKADKIATNSNEADMYIMNTKTTMLQFCYTHGSENDEQFQILNGNVEPHRGFGHIAFNVDDVNKTSEELEAKGVPFQKKPWEGRMKTIAFIKDPNGYWIELVNRNKNSGFTEPYNLSQTMIRVKDVQKSLEFYTKVFDMKLILQSNAGDFSLYFMMSIPEGMEHPDPKSDEAKEFVRNMWAPSLELTHNHGTEDDEQFSYFNAANCSNSFGHIGFVVDDLNSFSDEIQKAGYSTKPGTMKMDMEGVIYTADPDGYVIQVSQKGKNFSQFSDNE